MNEKKNIYWKNEADSEEGRMEEGKRAWRKRRKKNELQEDADESKYQDVSVI